MPGEKVAIPDAKPRRRLRLSLAAAVFVALVLLQTGLALTSIRNQFSIIGDASERIHDVSMAVVFDGARQVRQLERLANGGHAIIIAETAEQRRQLRQQLESIAVNGVLQGRAETRELVLQALQVIDTNIEALSHPVSGSREAALARWAPVAQSISDEAEIVTAAASTSALDDVESIFATIQSAQHFMEKMLAGFGLLLLTAYGLLYALVIRPMNRLTHSLQQARNGQVVAGHTETLEELRQLDAAVGELALAHRDLDVLRAALENEANSDQLTGLANRRCFNQRGRDELGRAQRYRRSIGLLALDLDHFKSVNDTHGHDAGDAVLSAVADVLRQSIRAQDLAVRLGGEEFAVMLPETEMHTAMLMAERLRERIAAHRITLPSGESLTLTASLGVTVSRGEDEDIYVVLQRADRALYRAKHGGRNRVEAAADEDDSAAPTLQAPPADSITEQSSASAPA